MNVFWRSWAKSRSSDAAQTVAGKHFASSCATEGPERVASGLDALSGSSVFSLRTSAMICVGLSDVLFSTPLATEAMGMPAGTCVARRFQMSLINCVGTADTIIVASLKILSSSAVRRIVSGIR